MDLTSFFTWHNYSCLVLTKLIKLKREILHTDFWPAIGISLIGPVK